jgi:hypothetical protein
MRKQFMRNICLLILAVLATGMPLRAQGGDAGKLPTYTYLGEWAVPRPLWGDMRKVHDAERSLNDKLLADGTIISYGEFENLIHVEGEPTQGEWFTANSEGSILKALEAFFALPELTSPVRGASKHWDHLLQSRTHNARSGRFDGAYLSSSSWDVKPGQDHAFRDLLNGRFVPVLEKLIADGALISYSVDSEYYHTQKPGRVTLVTITADVSGVDKVDQALEAAFSEDPEIGPAFGSLTDSEGHRDFLLHVIHMVNK